MKKYKEYRVAIKFSYCEHWHFTWKEEAKSFDLDRYVLETGMFNDFDPFKPETNVIFCLYEYDDAHYFGRMVAKTDYYLVWTKWMESVKEVF